MKSFYFILFSLMITCLASEAQQSGPLISQADTFYTNQDWQAAAKAYENAFAKGETQTALSTNRLGFSYLSFGKYDLAIKNFELSLNKKPSPCR